MFLLAIRFSLLVHKTIPQSALIGRLSYKTVYYDLCVLRLIFYSFLLSPVLLCAMISFINEVTLPFFISSSLYFLLLYYLSRTSFFVGLPRASTSSHRRQPNSVIFVTKYYIYTCSIGKRLTLKTKQTNIFHHATKNGPKRGEDPHDACCRRRSRFRIFFSS